MKTKPLSIAVAVVFLFVLGTSAENPSHTANAAESIVSKVSVVSSTRDISDNEWKTLSFTAGRIIKHVDQARLAIVQMNKTQALDCITKGLMLTAIIHNTIPPVQVETEITSGDLVYKDSDDAAQLLIPIYNDSFRYDILAPVMRAKSEAQNQPSLKLVEAGIDYTTEYLDLHIAKMFLESAQRFLEDDKLADADKMLSSLLNRGIIFDNVNYEMPLSRAINLMAFSERAYNDGDVKASEAALRQASDIMSDYIKTVKTNERVILEKIRISLDDLADIVHDSARHTSFHSKFSSLWNELTGKIRHR